MKNGGQPHLYTRKGDKGETGLFSGERVEKTSNRVEAYGTVDEFNSILGVAKIHASPRLAGIIDGLQQQNFFLASELATNNPALVVKPLSAKDVEVIESLIDELMGEMPPSTHFVIPGGTQAAGFLHVARTVLRRAERHILRLQKEAELNPELLRYVNRLSDLMFALARFANIVDGEGDRCISRDGVFIQKKE